MKIEERIFLTITKLKKKQKFILKKWILILEKKNRKIIRFQTELQKKNEKGENRINEIKSTIEMNKKIAKEKHEESRELIKKFL